MKTQIEFLMAYIPARLDVTSERGASLVEYALLVALIAVVCIAAVTALGTAASENFTEVADEIGS
jgi:pilus assembly protein Flp/PilA